MPKLCPNAIQTGLKSLDLVGKSSCRLLLSNTYFSSVIEDFISLIGLWAACISRPPHSATLPPLLQKTYYQSQNGYSNILEWERCCVTAILHSLDSPLQSQQLYTSSLFNGIKFAKYMARAISGIFNKKTSFPSPTP